MKTIKMIFGGELNWEHWLFSAILAMLGFIVFKLFTYNRRTDRASDFNPYFWWKDNRVEFYIGVILFYILMRFHGDLSSVLNESFNFPLIQNVYLFVFTFGLLFTIILKKGRSFFGIRSKINASGELRASADFVGNRPDDR